MYRIEDIVDRVHCSDCVAFLKDTPDNSVDFVLTDPPFNVGLVYKGFDDAYQDEQYSQWCREWLSELYRILKDRHYAIIFTGDKKLFYVHKAIMESGLSYHHMLKWHKPGCQRALSGTVVFNRVELAFVCSKNKPDINLIHKKVIYQDYIKCRNTTPNQRGSVDHNARRPIELYEIIIKGFTNENDVVIDPFLGSGTTAIACTHLNRRFIGIELSPESCVISENRIKDETSQGVLFGVDSF